MSEAEELLSINPAPLSKKYRKKEVVGGYVKTPFAIRLDGVGFSKVFKGERVREKRIHDSLVDAAIYLMRRYGADVGFVSSDEISIAFLRNLPYGGRVFKIVSVPASIVSSVVSLRLGKPVFFDARVIQFSNAFEILEYIKYRMRVTGGNFLSSLYARKLGKQRQMPTVIEMYRVLATENLEYEDWMLYGTCIVPEIVEKEGINRKTGEKVRYLRRVYTAVSSYRTCISRIKRLTYNML